MEKWIYYNYTIIIFFMLYFVDWVNPGFLLTIFATAQVNERKL